MMSTIRRHRVEIQGHHFQHRWANWASEAFYDRAFTLRQAALLGPSGEHYKITPKE